MVANNACANSKIGTFFQTGKLPGDESTCAVDAEAVGVTPEGLITIRNFSEDEKKCGRNRRFVH